MKKNAFLTFIFSFFPGAGQMYQTYTKRGVSILILASLFVMLGFIFNAGIFAFPFVVIYVFSFFDTFNLRNMTDKQRTEYHDTYLWNTEAIKEMIPNSFIVKKNKFIGYTLIIIGAYIVLINVLGLFRSIEIIDEIARLIERYFPTLCLSTLVIFAGYKMIKE